MGKDGVEDCVVPVPIQPIPGEGDAYDYQDYGKHREATAPGVHDVHEPRIRQT